MIQKEQLQALIEKYQQGQCTEAEQALLESWYLQMNEAEHFNLSKDQLIAARQRSLLALEAMVTTTTTTKLWPRIAVAAAAVAAIVFGVWLYNYEVASSRKAPRNDVAHKNDIAPGKNTATLTLPNGSTIQLSDAKTGVVINATKDDATQLKYNDGSLVRSSLRGGTTRQPHDEIASSQNAPRNDGVMLTASTPRGGQYQFTLPDGTHVWLNAASKISFPAQFSGATRKILLSGEAYFEVAKNKAKPFIVETDGQEVTVLGTHFNINAYPDESNTKTTLLEGSVKVSASFLSASSLRGGTTRQPHTNDEIVLTPNQQATNTASTIKVTQVDPEDAILWKSGKFSFASEELASIMKQVSRWYDVDIVFQDNVQQIKVNGSVSRFANISVLLEKLEQTGLVHFKVEGRKVYVRR